MNGKYHEFLLSDSAPRRRATVSLTTLLAGLIIVFIQLLHRLQRCVAIDVRQLLALR